MNWSSFQTAGTQLISDLGSEVAPTLVGVAVAGVGIGIVVRMIGRFRSAI